MYPEGKICSMRKAMKIIKLQMRLQKSAFRKGFDVKKLRQAQAVYN